jgi:4-hydroxybenzoate polyprenyltransferase
MLMVPFVNESKEIPYLIIVFIVLQTIGQLIYFDCRDYNRDEKSLLTIPQLIGVKKSKNLALLLFLFSLALLIICENFSLFVVLVFLSNIMGFFVRKDKQETAFAEFIWDLPFFIIGVSFVWY